MVAKHAEAAAGITTTFCFSHGSAGPDTVLGSPPILDIKFCFSEHPGMCCVFIHLDEKS